MLDFLKWIVQPEQEYHFDFESAKKVCRILVIDDDPQALPMDELVKSGYNISQEEEVDVHLMARCEDEHYDVILLDYIGVAPESITPDDGFGVFDRIRSANSSQYIIAISGQTFDISRTEYFKNANDWLKKPTDLIKTKEKLDKSIRRCFNRNMLLDDIRSILRNEGVSDSDVEKVLRYLRKTLTSDADKIVSGVQKLLRASGIWPDILGFLRKLAKTEYTQ